MQKTWVLVADSARARFFSVKTPKGPLTELEDYVHPASRAHERDLVPDRPGRVRSHSTSQRHTLTPPTSAKDQEALDFAREIAARADTARLQGDFERLVLVAAPDFLGTLRKKLPAPTAKLVDRTIDKNLTQLSAAEIRRHLPKYL